MNPGAALSKLERAPHCASFDMLQGGGRRAGRPALRVRDFTDFVKVRLGALGRATTRVRMMSAEAIEIVPSGQACPPCARPFRLRGTVNAFTDRTML